MTDAAHDATEFEASQADAPAAEHMARADAPIALFDLLVRNERDVVGMVAYSLHELSRREWLEVFASGERRDPSPAELQAFMIGERTNRRLALYRQEAEAALAANAAPSPGSRALPQAIGIQDIAAGEVGIKQPTTRRPEDRSKIGNILQQLVGSPALQDTSAIAVPPVGGLKAMFKYLIILLLLVAALAIVVNYAKTFFAN